MIDRQHGRIVIECDSCPETYEASTKVFVDAWAEAKVEGWTAFKIGNEWLHRCPECGVPK